MVNCMVGHGMEMEPTFTGTKGREAGRLGQGRVTVTTLGGKLRRLQRRSGQRSADQRTRTEAKWRTLEFTSFPLIWYSKNSGLSMSKFQSLAPLKQLTMKNQKGYWTDGDYGNFSDDEFVQC